MTELARLRYHGDAAERARVVLASATEGLPQLDHRGAVPSGIHRVDLAEVVERFGTENDARKALTQQLARHLRDLRPAVAGVVIGGSWLSAKPVPGDVDVDWIARRGALTDWHLNRVHAWRPRQAGIDGIDALSENLWARHHVGGQAGESVLEFLMRGRDGAGRGVALVPSSSFRDGFRAVRLLVR